MEDYWNIFGHEITDSDYAQELCLENSADELPQAAFLYFPQLLEKSTASYYHRKCPFLTNKPYLPLDRDRSPGLLNFIGFPQALARALARCRSEVP